MHQNCLWLCLCPDPIDRVYSSLRVPSTVYRRSHWLLTAAAPSDSVFRALGTNLLTYLLTSRQNRVEKHPFYHPLIIIILRQCSGVI